jgi:hypothetical protein
LSGNFEEDADTGGSIIGTRDVIITVGIVLFLITPRTRVVMSTQEDAGTG